MANEIQFDLNGLTAGMNFSGSGTNFNLEELLNEISHMFDGVMTSINEQAKDEYRTRLKEAIVANGGVVTERANELIEKAVNGTITPAEEKELINLLPPDYFGNQSDFADMTTGDLIHILGQPLSSDTAAAAIELRNRASVDGYVSPELNALLNHARLHGGLTESEQIRLYQLLQSEDAL